MLTNPTKEIESPNSSGTNPTCVVQDLKHCKNMTEFSHYFEEMKTNKMAALILEFNAITAAVKSIEEKMGLTCVAGAHPANAAKNRYSSILPYDQTRVKILGRIFPDDYINANIVPFIENPDLAEFIVTQGPVEHSVGDFWRMVIDQGINSILMLTRTMQGNIVKCIQYWPDNIGSTSYYGEDGEIAVVFQEQKETESYFERTFIVKSRSSNLERKVTQLHFHTWDDMCVPRVEDVDQLLARLYQLQGTVIRPPYLVHCSAGVGRTGTLISILRIVKQLINGVEEIDVFETVINLRRYRVELVEQASLYVFIHEYIDHFLRRYMRLGEDDKGKIYFSEGTSVSDPFTEGL